MKQYDTQKIWDERKPEPVRLTWLQWDEIFETDILDPDGFRNTPMDRLYSKQEFFGRLNECTRDFDGADNNRFGV